MSTQKQVNQIIMLS